MIVLEYGLQSDQAVFDIISFTTLNNIFVVHF